MSTRRSLKFTVDSALLEELGERLVGKPYIALAELVKNSYDADANEVTINFYPNKKYIEVNDKGHGMTEKEFEELWMRVGSTHKRGKLSRNYKRKMTGSKGVGRLAVQYLANEFEMSTVSEKDLKTKIIATIKWKDAIKREKNLTDVSVFYKIIKNEENFSKGTNIRLMGLKHKWKEDQITGLAQEIWWLTPPFRSKAYTEIEEGKKFDINFNSSIKEYEKLFNTQMKAIMDIWYARIVGKNNKGKISIFLEYSNGDSSVYNHVINKCIINNGDWEIRIYYLSNRQPHGISVSDARKYMKKFGAVYVYDGGFQLPNYGDPENDWLKIQYDFSRRLTASELLPENMREKGGMQFLPGLDRILGIININTANENSLDMLITRDRLNEETLAFKQLVEMVRVGLDYYSLIERKKRIEQNLEKAPIEKPKVTKLLEVVDLYKDSINPIQFNELRSNIKIISEDFESEAESVAEQVSIISPLATAGISSIAIEHEKKWQTKTLDSIIQQIDEINYNEDRNTLRQKIQALKNDIIKWSNKVKMQSSLFDYFKNSDNITNKDRYSSKKVIEDIINQVQILARDVKFDTNKIDYLPLPKASLVEWTSIFQNVFLNAFNAMIDSEKKIVSIKTIIEDRKRSILIQDTGCGVDLKKSEELFKPFVRELKISPERIGLGYGGSGLGLTIVRLVARNIGCDVKFVEPEKGFSTAFSLSWSETK